jgi:radical SAM superfamily enzyme YgiQ (UPF0313 family)
MPRDRRVAFLARDLVWADQSGGSLAFSYAARKLEASVRTAPDLGDVETKVIDLRTDEAEAFVAAIREFRPSVVAASTYIWSVELFCRVAEEVRRWDPSVRFVMGGPAARPSLLDLAPYRARARKLDAVVAGEGEEIIRQVVRAPVGDRWQASVPGLQVPGPLGWRNTGMAERPVLDDYASPYQLEGVPRGGIGYLETFRGCPISCAFCQWGVERSERAYSTDYLASHLHGLRDAGVRTAYVLDAGLNLNARAFRNLASAEREVGILREMQVLGHIYPTLLREEHVEFFESIGHADITVGIQSFDSAVLKRLGRPFDMVRFERVLRELSGRFDLDLELILGLPGDDPASFRRTFEKAIELGDSVRVFRCLALPDALLERASEFDIDFDPVTFEMRSCAGWTAESLRAEWDHVRRVAATMHRPNFGPNWTDFWTPRSHQGQSPPQEVVPSEPSIRPELIERLGRTIEGSASGWQLAEARADAGTLLLELDAEGGRMVLEATTAHPDRRSFREHDGIAYSHRGPLEQADAMRLQRFIAQIHTDIRPLVLAIEESTR